MAYGDGLTGGFASGHGGRGPYIARTNATDKPPANLVGSSQFTSGEGAGSGDESARAVVIGSLGLEEPQDSLCAVGGPCSSKTTVGLA